MGSLWKVGQKNPTNSSCWCLGLEVLQRLLTLTKSSTLWKSSSPGKGVALPTIIYHLSMFQSHLIRWTVKSLELFKWSFWATSFPYWLVPYSCPKMKVRGKLSFSYKCFKTVGVSFKKNKIHISLEYLYFSKYSYSSPHSFLVPWSKKDTCLCLSKASIDIS